MTADTIEEALIELDAALEDEWSSSLENRDELLAELATLRAHSAALRTIAASVSRWWLERDEYGVDSCVGCAVVVFDDDYNHAADCWAAPIIAMMDGMGET